MLGLFTDLSNVLKIILVMAIAYLLGSVNIAIIVTKLFTGKDIRTMGSGNAGFTNVMRSVGKAAGILTFVGDFLKCVIAVIIGGLIFKTMNSTANAVELSGYGRYLAGMCCFLGHIFPIYFKFKGGKGVVTMAALSLVINFPVFAVSFVTFAVTFVITRIVSISSIIGSSMLVVSTFLITYFYNYKYLGAVSFGYVVTVSVLTLAISATTIIKHKDNIKRLLKGEEKKLELKKSK